MRRRRFFAGIIAVGAVDALLVVACGTSTFTSSDASAPDVDASTADVVPAQDASAQDAAADSSFPISDATDGDATDGDAGVVLIDGGLIEGGACAIESDCTPPSSCVTFSICSGKCLYEIATPGATCHPSDNCCLDGECAPAVCTLR